MFASILKGDTPEAVQEKALMLYTYFSILHRLLDPHVARRTYLTFHSPGTQGFEKSLLSLHIQPGFLQLYVQKGLCLSLEPV